MRRPPGGERVPLTVWAVTALHVGLLLTFSVLYPPFTGFDETQHVDAVLSIRHGDGWPAPQERELSEGIVAVATPLLQAASALPFSDDEVLPRDERPSVAELGVERDSVGQLLPNQITQHPPLYYALQAGVLAVLPGSADWPFDRTVGVLRLVSVLLMAPLPLLAWGTARALRAPPLAAQVAALLTVSVPQLQRVGSSVNNDAAYTLAFTTVLLLLARVAGGDVRRRTVVLTGVAVGVAMLTKGFALVLPLAVGLAFLVGGRRDSSDGATTRSWTAGLLPGFLSLVVAFVVGGWWWLRNILLYGTVQPSGWPARYRDVLRLEPRAPGEPAPLGPFLEGSYSRLSERFWGGLAINYVGPDSFPHWLTNALAVAALVAVGAAVVGAGRSRLPLVVAVLVPFASTVGIIGYGIWTGYTYSLDFPGAQGRYLFGNLPSLAAAVALGLLVLARRARAVVPVGAALLALGMQAAGLYSVLSRSWLPAYDGRGRVERYREALDGIVGYAPWPTAATLAAFVLTALAAAVVLVLAVRLAVVREPEPEPATA
jgi:4-amino-4-deoxy-L-arabinose transferase-like glycosyltransferase